jgi:hypothetical protein
MSDSILGLDDYIWVDQKDRLLVSRNLGTTPPSFSGAGSYANDVGCLRRGIRFGDIDGDGS